MIKISLLSLIALSFITLPSFADDLTPELREAVNEEMQRPHFGLMFGVSTPEDDLEPGGQYNIAFGLQPYVPFSLSVEAGYASYKGEESSLNRTSLLIKGQYNFGGNIPIIEHSYVGLGLGPAWETSKTGDGVAFITLPNVGFDIPLRTQQPLSLGINVSSLLSSRDSADTLTTSAVLKYWY
ncbi:MAG: hypothetical protein MK008_14755 [Bdellovibrionales bacterium]|nr:hypothetical protein [Bdellovibrionales bacterium]